MIHVINAVVSMFAAVAAAVVYGQGGDWEFLAFLALWTTFMSGQIK